MHTIGLDRRDHIHDIELGFVDLQSRVEIYERARVDMIANQADRQKFWEVMESCLSTVFVKDLKCVTLPIIQAEDEDYYTCYNCYLLECSFDSGAFLFERLKQVSYES